MEAVMIFRRILGLLGRGRKPKKRRARRAKAPVMPLVRKGASAMETNSDGSRIAAGYDQAVHGDGDILEPTTVVVADVDQAAAPAAAAVSPRVVVETRVTGADPDDEPVDPVSPGKDLLDDMAHISSDAERELHERGGLAAKPYQA
jgi:hypothetical protein